MKKLVLWFATLCLLFSMAVFPVGAAELPAEPSQATSETRDVETVWIKRTYNGKQQKRLWSITDQCWLTDWIDI